MATTSPVNAGVSYLMQTLSAVDSSVLSSPAAVSALESASPADIVQLSSSATQLEAVDAIFGAADGFQAPSDQTNNTLTTLAALQDSQSNSTPPASSSTAPQVTGQGGLQAEEAQQMLSDSLDAPSGSLLNIVG